MIVLQKQEKSWLSFDHQIMIIDYFKLDLGATDKPAHSVQLYTPLFCCSVTFSTSLIHHHTPCHHDLLHEPLCSLAHNVCLCWTLYQLHHWTSPTYLMDMWFMDLVATFLFLVTQHAPTVAQPIMSHHAMWSETYYSFISDEPCAHFLDYHSYLTYLYLPFKPERKFSPQISDLVCSAWSFHLTPLHTFSLLHTCLASYPLPCTISHSLLLCQETIPYPLITPSEPHWAHTVIELYSSLFLI